MAQVIRHVRIDKNTVTKTDITNHKSTFQYFCFDIFARDPIKPFIEVFR